MFNLSKLFKLFDFKLNSRTMKYEVIPDQELEEFLKEEDLVIIDVRSKKEFDNIRVINSINIPIDVIKRIDIDKDKKLLIYCLTGVRTMKAIKILYNLGYRNLYIWGTGGLNTLKNKKMLEK